MIFKWLGDRLYEYFEYINSSSYFLFGPNYMDHHIVMKVSCWCVVYSHSGMQNGLVERGLETLRG